MKIEKRDPLENVQKENLWPEKVQTLYDTIGEKKFIKIVKKLGGQKIHIPSISTLKKDRRDQKILEEHNGHNTKELAEKYKLSIDSIQRIVYF